MSDTQIIRANGRPLDSMRSIEFIRNYTKYAEGSVLTVFGDTKVICTASIEESVPPIRGWIVKPPEGVNRGGLRKSSD